MKKIITILLFSAATFVAVAADSTLDCLIASDRTTYKVGDVPKLTVFITNKSSKEVMLVGGLDGSAVGWRFPKCRIEIRDIAGKRVTAQAVRCGNMNVLKKSDFVVIPAGGHFDPFSGGFFPPIEFYKFPVTSPGVYTVQFYYSTSDRLKDYFGDERMQSRKTASPEIERAFKRVPKVNLRSNELKLTFTSN